MAPELDEPLVMYDSAGTSNRTWLHADARGSIIAHTNSSGARTAVLTYDEYGNVVAEEVAGAGALIRASGYAGAATALMTRSPEMGACD